MRELAPGAACVVADPTVPWTRRCSTPPARSLRLVANFAVGYDNVDLDACREPWREGHQHTRRAHQRHSGARAGAHTCRGAPPQEAERDLRAGRWTGWDPAAYRGLELSGATVGDRRPGQDRQPLRRAAARASGSSSSTPPARPRRRPRRRSGRGGSICEELLRRADVVSLHAPASAETRHLIGADGAAAGSGPTRCSSTPRAARWSTWTRVAAALARGAARGGRARRLRGRARGAAGDPRRRRGPFSTPHIGSATLRPATRWRAPSRRT